MFISYTCLALAICIPVRFLGKVGLAPESNGITNVVFNRVTYKAGVTVRVKCP